MNKYILTLVSIVTFAFSNLSSLYSQSISQLSATEFAGKLTEHPSATIIDVRTPNEFSKGHLKNSINLDWNGEDFQDQISLLDKEQPVYIYCLSGGRSSLAAKKMQSVGFIEVYELAGGFMAWRAISFPETGINTNLSTGLSKEQFDNLLHSDKLVLIVFYADWCVPCKKMKPDIDEIATVLESKVNVFRINVDENKELCKSLNINTVPYLQVYQDKSLIWSNSGYIDKEGLLSHLK